MFPVSAGSRAQAVVDTATNATLQIRDINDQLADYMLQNDKNKTQQLGNAIFKTKRNMQHVQNQSKQDSPSTLVGLFFSILVFKIIGFVS